MDFKFSDCVQSFRSSAIRDLMSLATRSDIISFAGGMPGNELFPVEDMVEMSAKFSRKQWEEAMQYGPTPGNPGLVKELTEFLRRRNFPVDRNKLIITTGSLQGLNIIAKLFINPGDNLTRNTGSTHNTTRFTLPKCTAKETRLLHPIRGIYLNPQARCCTSYREIQCN